MSAAASGYSYDTVAVTVPREHVYMVSINRPETRNLLNKTFWWEIGECFDQLAEDKECRAVVLGGEGNVFTAGIDLMDLASVKETLTGGEDVARNGRALLKAITDFQRSFSALERCPKPVIAAVNGACVGLGVDLICGTDIRYCTSNAWFQVKEVDVGLAADVGTLQRLPKIIGSQSLVRELAFAAKKLSSGEALQCGFVSRVFESKETLVEAALDVASTIASKSPVAVQTTKRVLVHARDHSVREGLDYVATLNMLMLQSEDVRIAAMAMMSRGKDKPTFSKL